MQLDRRGDKSSQGVLKKEGNQDEKTITEMITQNQKRTGTAENTERVKQGKIERREQITVEIISAHNKLQIKRHVGRPTKIDSHPYIFNTPKVKE